MKQFRAYLPGGVTVHIKGTDIEETRDTVRIVQGTEIKAIFPIAQVLAVVQVDDEG